MLVLAFDTTSEHGGAGIYRNDECLASAANRDPAHRYSVTLFEMVDRLLAEAAARHPPQGSQGGQEGRDKTPAAPPLSLRDIGLFAVATGPGSFTGIRVGLAAAKGWATAFGRPVKGVSVLEAMVAEACPQAEWAVPILDARRGEFFLTLFRRDSRSEGSGFEQQGVGLVMKPQALGPFLEELACGEPSPAPSGLAHSGAWPAGAAVTCVTRDDDRLAQGLRASLPESLGWQTVSGTFVPAIARLALQACRQGSVQSPVKLDAYYIRRPDATVPVPKF